MDQNNYLQNSRIEDGQVQVPLEGELDLQGLSKDLQKRGFFLANDPEEIDSQGWGKGYDPEGYYPYRVFRDGDRWIFACTPKDVVTGTGGRRKYTIADRAREEIESWVPYIQKWCR